MTAIDQIAAERDYGMDWMQVRLNGGPPCFHREPDGVLCGRAKYWDGHGFCHEYVSLAAFVAAEIDRLERAAERHKDHP